MTTRRWWLSGIVVAVLATVVFIPGLSSEFTWDDNGLIRTNENIQQPEHYREALTTHFWNVSSSAAEINITYNHLYRPLVTLAYIVEFRLFGLNAFGYRVVSLGLHALCCLLAFFWLRRRLPDGNETKQLAAVALATAVFAVHPSRVEAVSWISGSTELWMCALILLGTLAFDSKRSWLAGLLLALAFFAKETAIVAAPLLLADRFLLRGERDRKSSVALVVPVIGALLARSLLVDVDFPHAHTQGAVPRVLASFGLFARQIVSPFNPTAFPGMRIYSCEGGESLPVAWQVGGVLLVGAGLGIGILAARQERWRPALADFLWFLLPLLPVANFLDLGSRNLIADRFLYLPLLGVVSLLARGLIALLERRPTLGKLVGSSLVALVLALAVVTSLHSRVFASSSALWEYEVTRNPDNPFALHAVGTARIRAGLPRSGTQLLVRAQDVAERTCVHVDQVRSARDLGWALALTTLPDDRETLIALEEAYAMVATEGLFRFDGAPSWSVQLSSAEIAELVTDDLQYTLPRAMVQARLGRIRPASEILLDTKARVGDLHPLSEDLRIQLTAADGDVRRAMVERSLRRISARPDTLLSVLGVLKEMFDNASIEPEDQAPLTGYALGFGSANDSVLASRSEVDRAVIQALRHYNTSEPVDISTLERIASEGTSLGRFVEIAKEKERLRDLDEQLADR